MNDYAEEQNDVQNLLQNLEIFKETFNNLNIYEINLQELKTTLKKLIEDLDWLYLLDQTSQSIIAAQSKCIQKITSHLTTWKTAEISNAGSNSQKFIPMIQKTIDECYKTLLAILFYYKDCKSRKVKQVSEQIYNSHKSYNLSSFFYKLKQSFITSTERLDQSSEVTLANLICALEKHFCLFLPKVSNLLVSELQNNLGFRDKIGLSQLEELFFVVLGSRENFRVFLMRNKWYLIIEEELNGCLREIRSGDRGERRVVKFQIDVLFEGIEFSGGVFDCEDAGGGVSRERLVTIGADGDFVNDVRLMNMGEGWEVVAVVFIKNSNIYISKTSPNPIELYAFPNTEIEITKKALIKIEQTKIFTRISRTGNLRLRFRERIETIPLSLPSSSYSIGSSPDCNYYIPSQDSSSTFLEIYNQDSKFFFKTTGEAKVTYTPRSQAILLTDEQFFFIPPFKFQIKHIN